MVLVWSMQGRMNKEQKELIIWLMESEYKERAEWAWLNGLKED